MLKAVVILLLIVFAGFLLYFMPIQIKLKSVRKDENDLIIIRYRSLYGLLNLKLELPMLDIVFVNGKPALKYKAAVQSGKTNKLFKRIAKIFTQEDWKNIRKYLKGDKILMHRMIEYWLSRIVLRDLSIILKLGLLDAAITAALCGAAWTALGALLSIMKSHLDMTIKNFTIAPILDKQRLEIEISCIIKFRLGDIINTGVIVLKRKRELKKISHSSYSQLSY